jgi:hypothetical protein
MHRYKELEVSGHPYPAKQASIEFFGEANYRKRKSYLSSWLSDVDKFYRAVKVGKRRRRLPGGGRKVQFPAEENELYVRLLVRRQAHGFPCDHFWLQSEFKRILEESKPRGWRRCKYSWGWAIGFCVRYRLSVQAKNNIKAKDQVDREEEIRKFHKYWLEVVQKSEPRTDGKYGRFKASRIFHVDQVPLTFASPHTRTLNPIGAPSCRVAGPNTAGLEKRQGTLQMYICADKDKQVVRCAIIFRGTSGVRSKLPWPEERAAYAKLKHLTVYFQEKAWANEKFCEEDILRVAADLGKAGVHDQVVLGMDNHASQRTPAMLELYSDLGIFPLFTPSDCTDCVSPVDHHCGRFVQAHMAACYKKDLEARREIWMAMAGDNENDVADPNGSSAMMRRICMAQWADEALEKLLTQNKHTIHQAFFNTGFLLALDGSEDALMRLQGWDSSKPYVFR